MPCSSWARPPRLPRLTIAAPTTWVYLWRSLGYVLIFLLAGQIAARSTRRWTATLPLLLFGVVEAAWVMSQYAAGETTRPGSYFSKDHLAGLLEMVLPLAAAYGIAVLYRARRARSPLWASTPSRQAACSPRRWRSLPRSRSRCREPVSCRALGSMVVMGTLASGGGRPGRWRWPLMGALVLAIAIVVRLRHSRRPRATPGPARRRRRQRRPPADLERHAPPDCATSRSSASASATSIPRSSATRRRPSAWPGPPPTTTTCSSWPSWA